MTQNSYNAAVHRTAQLTTVATLLLIFMGGLVTSHGAGMSVPDWPNSWGYNMFTFPPSMWIGGIFYEHTHRLMGTVVGLLSIALVILAWKYDSRRWVRWLCVAVLGAVILQGVLGGLRVVWVQLDLAIVHACVAQAFLCMAALAAVVTSRWWLNAPHENNPSGTRLIALAVACAVVVYLQLVVGALMRHYEAGLAIPDFPLNYGKLLPPTTETQLAVVNLHRIELGMRSITLGQIWLHFAHRVGAVVVTAMVVWLAMAAFRRGVHAFRWPARWLNALLVTQLTLGIWTVLRGKPADIASLHVAVGATILMTVFVLLVRTIRLYGPRNLELDFASHPAPATA